MSLCFCLIGIRRRWGDWGLLWPLVILVVVVTDLNEKYDGEEDSGEEETPEKRATILHCVFRDFCRPPWAPSALRPGGAARSRGMPPRGPTKTTTTTTRGRTRRRRMDDDDDDDDAEGGDVRT
jgi:hypothetical protein